MNAEDLKNIAKNIGALKLMNGPAVSIWQVMGLPKVQGGLLGARRSAIFLMPMKAEAGDVFMRFIEECSRTDGVEYVEARFDEVRYLGWAWLPGLLPSEPAEPTP